MFAASVCDGGPLRWRTGTRMTWSRQPADIITEGKETNENAGAAGRVNGEVATDQSDRLSAASVSAVHPNLTNVTIYTTIFQNLK